MNVLRVSPRLTAVLGIIFTIASAASAQSSAQAPRQACFKSFEEAQVEQKHGKLLAARKLFIECSSPACPGQLRDDCLRKQDELEKATPTASFVVRDANENEVSNALVKVDGVELSAPPGHATPIDPGVHEIEVSYGGAPGTTSKITIHEGEKSRLIVLKSASIGSHPGTEPPPSNQRSGSLVGPLVVGGVGTLAVLTGVLFLVLSDNQADKRDQRYLEASRAPVEQRPQFEASARSFDDAAKNQQMLAFVAGGAGLVAIGVAAAWYFIDRPSRSAGTSPWLTPSVGGSRAGVELSF